MGRNLKWWLERSDADAIQHSGFPDVRFIYVYESDQMLSLGFRWNRLKGYSGV
jgi:hypothetical protein